jgi:hypothetical protein
MTSKNDKKIGEPTLARGVGKLYFSMEKKKVYDTCPA